MYFYLKETRMFFNSITVALTVIVCYIGHSFMGLFAKYKYVKICKKIYCQVRNDPKSIVLVGDHLKWLRERQNMKI